MIHKIPHGNRFFLVQISNIVYCAERYILTLSKTQPDYFSLFIYTHSANFFFENQDPDKKILTKRPNYSGWPPYTYIYILYSEILGAFLRICLEFWAHYPFANTWGVLIHFSKIQKAEDGATSSAEAGGSGREPRGPCQGGGRSLGQGGGGRGRPGWCLSWPELRGPGV